MKTLKQKLATVAAAVQKVGKSGYNEGQRYRYVLAADVVRKIREELLNEGVIVSPSNRLLSTTPCKTNRGGDASLTTLELTLKFCDVDSDESMSSVTIGQGWDTNDKGAAKAMTMAYKYALIEMFLVEMSDDPEADAAADALTMDAERKPPDAHKCMADENGYCTVCNAVMGDMAYENDEPPPAGQAKPGVPPSTCPDCGKNTYATYAKGSPKAGQKYSDSKGRPYARCAACGTMWYADGTGYNPKTKESKK